MTKLSLALVRDFHNSSPPQNFIQVEEGPLSGKSRTVVPQVPLQLRRGGGHCRSETGQWSPIDFGWGDYGS